MQYLRNARHIFRLVLVWFALYMGAAIASPLIAPQGYELVCSGIGMVKLLATGADGSPGSPSNISMDCPLCATGGALPSPATIAWVAPAQPLAYATWPVPAARIAVRTAAAMPARGPPLGFPG